MTNTVGWFRDFSMQADELRLCRWRLYDFELIDVPLGGEGVVPGDVVAPLCMCPSRYRVSLWSDPVVLRPCHHATSGL